MDITVSIPDDTIASVILSGLSSGIGHWCRSAKITGRKKGRTSGDMDKPEYERYFRPIQDGALVVVEEDTGKKFVIDQFAVYSALTAIGRMYPGHMISMIRGETDALTGDVLIQVAAFGEIKYQ